MASLNIDKLLAPVTEDFPCGEDIDEQGGLFQIEQDSKGVPERQVGNQIVPAEPPNWRIVESQAIDLCAKTKDIRVYLHLIRSKLNTEGFSGFQDGLEVLQKNLQNYWDLIYPVLDPDDDYDPTFRVNLLMELCDSDSVLKTITSIPLAESKSIGRFSFRDINIANGRLAPVSTSEVEIPEWSTIQAAFSDTNVDLLSEKHEAVIRALGSVVAVESFVTDSVGISNAPNFGDLRTLLKDIEKCLGEQLVRHGVGVEEVDVDQGLEDQADIESGGNRLGNNRGVMTRIETRVDVVKALDLICEYYSRVEPSSPVPLLLGRAKKLVNMDFLAIMENMAPEGVNQIKVIAGLELSE
jgi:type VI secretion system protein ImpA